MSCLKGKFCLSVEKQHCVSVEDSLQSFYWFLSGHSQLEFTFVPFSKELSNY